MKKISISLLFLLFVFFSIETFSSNNKNKTSDKKEKKTDKVEKTETSKSKSSTNKNEKTSKSSKKEEKKIKELTNNKSTTTDTSTQTATIILNSIVCNSCVETITEAVNKIDGVKSIAIDLDKKVASVIFFPSKTSLEIIENKITDAGYDANDKKRNKNAFNNLDECCKIE